MGDFFGSLYCIFEDFFGLDLANYLWGGYSPEQTSNLYIGIGIYCIVISTIVFILYYLLIDNPRWARKGVFFLVVGINTIINFLLATWWCKRFLYAGKMIDADGNSLSIDASNCYAFGVTNAILAIAVFIIITFLFKGFSKNTWHIPCKLFGKYIKR